MPKDPQKLTAYSSLTHAYKKGYQENRTVEVPIREVYSIVYALILWSPLIRSSSTYLEHEYAHTRQMF